MSKDLSKQLCEICGLKYCKEKVVINEGQCPNVNIKPFYLNFEQPENFVRLLEIVSKKSSISFCHNGIYFGCSIHYFITNIFEADMGTIPHNFLNTLLKQHLSNPCKPELLEQLKQSIREAEWVYD